MPLEVLVVEYAKVRPRDGRVSREEHYIIRSDSLVIHLLAPDGNIVSVVSLLRAVYASVRDHEGLVYREQLGVALDDI